MHPLQPLRLRSRTLALVSAAAIAVTGAVAFTGLAITPTASAATSGLLIGLCFDQNAISADLSGVDEGGRAVNVNASPSVLRKDNREGCYYLPDVWWTGDVIVHWAHVDGSRLDRVCSVPASTDLDIFYCSDS